MYCIFLKTGANEWKTSSAYETVPVRADVTGEYIHSDGSTRPIHHVYEYHAFTGNREVDATVFEVMWKNFDVWILILYKWFMFYLPPFNEKVSHMEIVFKLTFLFRKLLTRTY